MQCSSQNTFVQHYQKTPSFLEHLSLRETTRSWTFYSNRRQDPWKPRDVNDIVQVLPWFYSIASQAPEEFETFCWIKLLLYKPFRDIPTEIGLLAEIIIKNWMNF